MSNYLNPVQLIIREFGGVTKLARAIQRDPAAVSRWQIRGRIPTSAQQEIVVAARERDLPISMHDIIFGRTER